MDGTYPRPQYDEYYYPIFNTPTSHILRRGGGYDQIAYDRSICDPTQSQCSCPRCSMMRYKYGVPCATRVGANKPPVMLNRRC